MYTEQRFGTLCITERYLVWWEDLHSGPFPAAGRKPMKVSVFQCLG